MDEGPRFSAPPRTDEVISQKRFEAYHRYAREHGVNRFLYVIGRFLLTPALLLWLRLDRQGREHASREGGLVVAANHRSFLDPFVIGSLLPWRRSLQFVAKVELFERPVVGWFLNRLGAFPIRRGQSDEVAMETARLTVERGGTVVIFPEGTRIRQGALGHPKRGVGRLALETGAPVLPIAVTGTDHVRRGWRIRSRKVRVRAGVPLTFTKTSRPSPGAAAEVTNRIWPSIELQWEYLGGLPPLRKAAVIGAGSWGTAVAVLLARGGLEVQLGTRSEDKARAIRRRGQNTEYLAGVDIPDGVTIKRASEIELAGCDLICFAVPSIAMPEAISTYAPQVGERAAVLLLTKGLIHPDGDLPTAYVAKQVTARAIACLGGPAHAREAAAGMAALVLGSSDLDLRSQLGEVFDRAGLVCERTDDVVGVEMAGVAKNAAAVAAAAAAPHGLNAAGIAAAGIWDECIDFAVDLGARPETFAGLAGVGDLTATILAEGSRNRRAGELLGKGMSARQIPGKIGQASEGLDSAPLIARTIAANGLPAPRLRGLASLIAGDIEVAEWIAGLRRAERARTTR